MVDINDFLHSDSDSTTPTVDVQSPTVSSNPVIPVTAEPPAQAQAIAVQQAPAPVAVQQAPAPAIDIHDFLGSSSTDTSLSTTDQSQAVAPIADSVQALSPEDQAKVREVAASINFASKDFDSTYGADAQTDMARFSDDVLSKTANKDTGEAGQLLTQLLTTVDDSALSGIKKIPIIGQVTMKLDEIRRAYQKVTPQIDEITAKLEKNKAIMANDIVMYDHMYEENARQYRRLKIYVTAGKQAVAEFEKNSMPELERQAVASNDQMVAQQFKDFKDKIERFKKRLDDLDRISVVALQTAPQIKLLQNSEKTIMDKIDTTLTTTIPVWKSQMVIAVGLHNAESALDLQNKVDDTTNKLLAQNASRLHTAAVNAEKANQRAVVDTETLAKVNSELISTLKETMQIQADGRRQREAAEGKMRQMEADLKKALIEQASSMK